MNKIRYLFGIAAVILTANLFSTAVQAAEITIDSLTYQTNENGTASVSYCERDFVGSVTILSSITVDETSYTVTSIGSSAFYGCLVTNIVIPDSVTTIESMAFDNCDLLAHVTLGNNVATIGSQAFYDCPSLSRITIPASVTEIGFGAFSACPLLLEIQVDENNSVYKDIDGVLFSKDGSIIYNYPNGKTNTFYSIPDSVTSIDSWAFMHSCMLTNIVIGNSITEIENFSFSGCTSLTSITIGNSVTKIGGYAFERCYSLTDINIGNAVSVISYNAFEDCTSLAEIVIPNSVTFIANSAFKNCNSLRAVRFLNDTPPTTGEDGIFENCTADITIYHPIGAEANWGTYWQGYKTQPWGISESVILSNGSASIDPSSGLIIFKLVFTNNSQNISYTNIVSSSAGSLSIPSYIISEGAYYSVSSIGDNAFNNCTLLTEIIIPNTINSLGNNAFKNCSSLEWIRFQSYTPPVVGLDSFSGCPSDMLIYYPEGAEATWGTEWEGFTSLPYIEPIILNKVSESVDYQNNIVTFTLKFT